MSKKYQVTQEFMDSLGKWREAHYNHVGTQAINLVSLLRLPEDVQEWLTAREWPTEESNNRLIAIIRWVNGEDLFEVKKGDWIVRNKETDEIGDYRYVYIQRHWGMTEAKTTYEQAAATLFDTKEEAESWANSHQEVIEVEVEE